MGHLNFIAGNTTGCSIIKACQRSSAKNHMIFGLLCVGIILRTTQYLFNRSLWVDEAMLALNIIERPFSELLKPLQYNQTAPIGFLAIEIMIVQLLGASEYALRLFPFVCGVISLMLFVRVGKHFGENKSVILAIALFAISYKLIFYSSEVKQYSSDVAIALLLYATMVSIHAAGLNLARVLSFGIIGAVALWFSHPATFVLAGIGVSMSVCLMYKKQWSQTSLIMIAGLLWAGSFAVLYFVSLRNLNQNAELLNFWRNSFMPLPPRSLADLKWFDDTLISIFRDTLGLFPASIAAVLLLIGCISMAVEKKEKFLLLISPIVITMIASGLHVYPFSGRLLLFAVPFMFLLIADGVIRVGSLVREKQNLVVGAMTSVLLVPQLLYSSTILVKPYSFEEVRPAIEYMSEHWQPGDILYVYHGAQPTFRFYSGRYGFSSSEYIFGEGSRQSLPTVEAELLGLNGHGRLWLLLGHIDRSDGIDDDSLFREHFRRDRHTIDSFKSKDAAVYLFKKRDDLSLPRNLYVSRVS